MCKPMPGSPPLFLFFVGVRGEPGNEANKTLFASVGKTREREALIKIFRTLFSIFIEEVSHQ